MYIEEGSQIAKELYLALLVDRESASVAIMFSTEGGMNIEEVAEKTLKRLLPSRLIQSLAFRSITLEHFVLE